METEQDFIRISRLNEVYREELIQHRRRVSLAVLYPYALMRTCAARPACRQPDRATSVGAILTAHTSSGELHLQLAIEFDPCPPWPAQAYNSRTHTTCECCSNTTTAVSNSSPCQYHLVRVHDPSLAFTLLDQHFPLPVLSRDNLPVPRELCQRSHQHDDPSFGRFRRREPSHIHRGRRTDAILPARPPTLPILLLRLALDISAPALAPHLVLSRPRRDALPRRVPPQRPPLVQPARELRAAGRGDREFAEPEPGAQSQPPRERRTGCAHC